MEKKIFVLDTSVIIFDHKSIMNFAEHDIVIPITVLEELDTFKKGNDTKNYEAREFIRFLDKNSMDSLIQDWIALPGENKGRFKIAMETNGISKSAVKIYGADSMDNKIVNSCLIVQKDEPQRQVILVTKDVNLRLKAKALGIRAEDYETGKVRIVDNLPTGILTYTDFDQEIIDGLYRDYAIPLEKFESKMEIYPNAYYILQGEKSSALAYYNPFEQQLERVNKQTCFNIKPRNAEQAFAIHSLLKKEIKLVALHGVAGTGKTLIALAAALAQKKEFKQIYLARPIVPLSNKDIGYLPGD